MATNSTPKVRLKMVLQFRYWVLFRVVRAEPEPPESVMLAIGHFGPLVWYNGIHSHQYFQLI